jgi:hypothetical protein
VKFEDSILQEELLQYASELFVLEMKLRRVLTVIYLHAYQDGDPYDLLHEETVQPMTKPLPSADDMQKAIENQFFHITFSNYIELNRKPDITRVPLLINLIRSKNCYEDLCAELERLPIEDEDDAVFLAALKERMNTIDAMRNCVAHNRKPSNGVINNYKSFRPLVEQALDDFLARRSLAWQDQIQEIDTSPEGSVVESEDYTEEN